MPGEQRCRRFGSICKSPCSLIIVAVTRRVTESGLQLSVRRLCNSRRATSDSLGVAVYSLPCKRAKLVLVGTRFRQPGRLSYETSDTETTGSLISESLLESLNLVPTRANTICHRLPLLAARRQDSLLVPGSCLPCPTCRSREAQP